MAKINIKDVVSHDRALTYNTFRDHLAELVPFLPTVQSITVEDRQEPDASSVKVINLWKAEGEEIPKMAQAFIKPEMLQWHDHATWNNETFSCDWDMEVGFLKEAISCKGTTRYVERDGKTEVIIDGDLKVDAKKIPGVPGFMAGKVGDMVEKFVVKMITPNLTEVNRGVERYLAEKK